MLSSKDPAATQEFKISALAPGGGRGQRPDFRAGEVGERSLRERGGRPLDRGLGDSTGEFGMLARRAQPSGHRHRTGTCLIRRAESMELGMQHYAASGFTERTSGPAPRPRLKNPRPVYRNRLPWFSHVRKVKSRPGTAARPRSRGHSQITSQCRLESSRNREPRSPARPPQRGKK